MTAADQARTAVRRPGNRRRQILDTAAEQFRNRGYHCVSMADIAAAVGIGPSALYRHFLSKQDILVTVLTEYADQAEEVFADPVDVDALVVRSAQVSLDRREFGVLWAREAGHLPGDTADEIRRRLRGLADSLAGAFGRLDGVQRSAPGLRAWAMMSVLASPSHHRVDLDRTGFESIIADAVRAVLSLDLPSHSGDGRRVVGAAGLTPVSRREALLSASITLFADRGYAAVGLGDIGSAVGIAGPSVYNHFDRKLDLLTVSLDRGTATLWSGLRAALTAACDPVDGVRRLVDHYAGFAMANPDLLGVLITESAHLPDARREEYRATQLEYVTEWTSLLRTTRPDLGEAESRILVHAALSVINSLARIPHLRGRDDLGADVAALALAILTADSSSGPGHTEAAGIETL